MGNLIILLDADDVLLDTGSTKTKWMQENLTDADVIAPGRTIKDIQPYECNRSVLEKIIGHDNYERMTSYVYSQQGTDLTPVYKGAFEGIRELAKIGEVHVISARKPKDVVNTRNWLRNNDFMNFLTIARFPQQKILNTLM